MHHENLPPFRPVTQEELRRFWVENPTGPVRRLTLEVERYRRLIAEVDQMSRTIHQAWRDNVGGDLVALHRLKMLLMSEQDRSG